MSAVSRSIPRPRASLESRTRRPSLADVAEALIRDAVARYPAARVAAAGLNYADAATVHRLIQTAELHIRLTEEQP